MRKFLLVGLLALLLLGAALPVLATPVADLTALASYFPETTVMFGAMRTDDGLIETLDGVIGQMRELLPSGAIPPFKLTESLDQLVQTAGVSDFKSGVRSWLGATAAFGLTEIAAGGEQPHGLIAVAITDRAKAEAFLEKIFAQQIEAGYLERVDGDMTEFRLTASAGTSLPMLFAVTDEVFFYTVGAAPEEPEKPLSASADFKDTLAQLPADDYSLLGYVNMAPLVEFMTAVSEYNGEPIPAELQNLLAAAGSQAYGFTVLDGRSLVMDMAQTYGDTSALTAAGLSLDYPTTAFDPAFAARVPADAAFVVQGANIGQTTLVSFQNLRAAGKLIQEQLRALPDSPYLDADIKFGRMINMGSAMTAFANLSFAGMTGLNLEKDVLPGLDGQFAGYVGLVPQRDTKIMPDFGFVVETSDAAGPKALLDAVEAALTQYEIAYTREPLGEADALGVSLPLNALMQSSTVSDQPLDLVLASQDKLLAGGTRAAVIASLAPEGDTLADAPAYTEALSYALEDAQQFWYADLRALVPFLDQQLGRSDLADYQKRDLSDLRDLAGLMNSAAISATMTESGCTARFVLTLAADPLEPASGS